MSELFLHRNRKLPKIEKNAVNLTGHEKRVVTDAVIEAGPPHGDGDRRRQQTTPRRHSITMTLSDSDDDFFSLDSPSSHTSHRSKRQRLDIESIFDKSASIDNPDSKYPIPSSSEVQFEQAPFYKDPFYDVVMYRGPGYDMFPVVLGTVNGHEEYCTQWEAERTSTIIYDPETRTNLNGYVTKDIGQKTGFETPSSDDEAAITAWEREVLTEIMIILPNIQRKYVVEQINKHVTARTMEEAKMETHLVVERIIENILGQSGPYPQEKEEKQPKIEVAIVQDPTGQTIMWDKAGRKDRNYIAYSVLFLANEFERVPNVFLRETVKNTMSLFDSYLTVYTAEANYIENAADQAYTHLKRQKAVLERRHMKGGASRFDKGQYAQIVNEFQAAKQHVTREAIRQVDEQEKKEAELLNFALHEVNGELVECQCCFDSDVPINRTVICEGLEVHFFCFGCVARLAETQVGIMKHEMQCMDGSGCKAMLSNAGIQSAIPQRLLDRLALNEQQYILREADIEGLEQCQSCEFMAICSSVEIDSEFACENPDCMKVHCRRCKKPSHLPAKCREDEHLDARHRVEEARSEAMMRSCPKCKVKIIKELGCNKMPCTNCRTIMCYVCKADISAEKDGGYLHFRTTGSRCPLYDAAGVDRHVTEADEAEKKAIEAVRQTNATLDAARLAIETNNVVTPQTKPVMNNIILPPIPPPAPIPRFHVPRIPFLNQPPPPPIPLVPDDGYRQRLAVLNRLRRGHA